MKSAKKSLSIVLAGVAIWATCSFAKAEEGNENRERHHHPRLNLTDEQRLCLEGLIGKPGERERPSRAEMDKALSTCNIPKPKHPPRRDGDQQPPEDAANGAPPPGEAFD